jgi:NAD+ synthase (glutamine-hydrolysing)
LVFRICRWVNESRGPTIPQNTIDKPPSAELRPDQKDTDSLPDYDVLDDMLERYVEKHQTKQELIEAGFKLEEVEKVTRLLKIAEFKRRQAAPGLKITDRAFGTGWRMPIASKIYAGTPKDD